MIAAGLTVVTAAAIWYRRDRVHATVLGFAAFTVLVLIVYPNTLYNTLPLILPVLVLVLFLADDLAMPPVAVVAMVASAYALVVTRATPGIIMLVVVWGFVLFTLVRLPVVDESPAVVERVA